MKVTFIVIAYNLEKYIERCIRSIMTQSLKDIQIIVVNNESNDKTLEIINKLSEEDERIKIINKRNIGVDAARKKGLEYAEGKYIVFVDGDDWVSENLAKDLYEIAESKKSDIVCFNYYWAYENGENKKNEQQVYDRISDNKFLELILQQKLSHNIWNKFLKKEFIDRTSLKRVSGLSMGEDLVDCVTLGIKKPEVYMIDVPYYFYYQRSDSIMKQSSEKFLDIEPALNSIEKILQGENLHLKYKKEMEYLWFLHCYSRVFNSNCRMDKYYKQLYYMWKKKRIKDKENLYCIEFTNKLKGKRRVLKSLFDMNFYFGSFYLYARDVLKGNR